MLTVRRLPAVGLTVTGLLLVLLSASVGLGAAGWVVGLLCGFAVSSMVSVGLDRFGAPGPGPADLVTFARAVTTCGLAALTTDALLHHVVTVVFVPLAVVALSLDAVDGRVARRTGTCSAFGSRFDGEADAFLILVLSAYVAPTVGTWILSAGLVRYAFGLAGALVPWMGGRLPFRYWRKVVTATMGITLAVAAAGVGPRWWWTGAVLVGVAMLAESFGRDVWWLWTHRVVAAAVSPVVNPVVNPVVSPVLDPVLRTVGGRARPHTERV